MVNSNVFNPKLPHLTLVTVVQIDIAGGAYGWIDTDASATLGVDCDRIWLIYFTTDGAAGYGGARPHGSAKEAKLFSQTGTLLSHVDSNGHIDLTRDAADKHYYFVGYLS